MNEIISTDSLTRVVRKRNTRTKHGPMRAPLEHSAAIAYICLPQRCHLALTLWRALPGRGAVSNVVRRALTTPSRRRSPLELGLIAAATAGALSMLFPLLMPGGGHAGSAERSEPHLQHLQQQPADERTLLFRAGSGLAGFSEFVMTRVDKGLEKFPSIPSLDPQECMKRSVCEAHNQPNKYGLIGLALQLLYP